MIAGGDLFDLAGTSADVDPLIRAAYGIITHTAACLRRHGFKPLPETLAIAQVAQDWLRGQEGLATAVTKVRALTLDPPRGLSVAVEKLTYSGHHLATMLDDIDEPDALGQLAGRLNWLSSCARAAVAFSYPTDDQAVIKKREERWQLRCLREALTFIPTSISAFCGDRLCNSLLAERGISLTTAS